jgi:hypothetical protein
MNGVAVFRNAIALATVAGCMFSTACGGHHDEGHAMVLEYDPALRFPAAFTSVAGGRVTISTMTMAGGMHRDTAALFEPPADGFAYRAWARAGDAWTDLGAFVPGTDLVADAASGTAVQVTIEAAGAAPAAPSVEVVLSGTAGADLAFGKLDALAFTPAHVEVTAGGTSVDLACHDLPALPAGFHYALWLTEVDEAGAAKGAPVTLGKVSAADGGLSATGVALPEHHVFDLSIEADHGAAPRSPLVCFRGTHGATPGTGGTGGHGH